MVLEAMLAYNGHVRLYLIPVLKMVDERSLGSSVAAGTGAGNCDGPSSLAAAVPAVAPSRSAWHRVGGERGIAKSASCE